MSYTLGKLPKESIVVFKAAADFDVADEIESAARGEASPMHHPKLRQMIFVTRNPAFKMAAEGLGHDIFGNMFVPVYENYEDALAVVRAQLE